MSCGRALAALARKRVGLTDGALIYHFLNRKSCGMVGWASLHRELVGEPQNLGEAARIKPVEPGQSNQDTLSTSIS